MRFGTDKIAALTTHRLENSGRKHLYHLLTDGDAFYTDLEQTIRQARSSIKMQVLTYEADHTGQGIARALLEAAQRGVQVRLLVDHYASMYHREHLIFLPRTDVKTWREIRQARAATEKLFQTLMEHGIQVKRTCSPGVLFHRALLRDHKKLIIIDDEEDEEGIAYVGGFNIANHHMQWHDFMVKIRGKIVGDISADFDRTWHYGWNIGQKITYSDGYIISDYPGSSLILQTAIEIMLNARRRIVLESPYVYGRAMQHSLIQAARRDIETSLIVPLHNNHRLCVFSEQTLKKLARHGVQIYQYQRRGGMTHAKVLLVDDMVMFGSANFNQFLAGKLAELNILSSHVGIVSCLEAALHVDMMNSYKISFERWR